MTGATIGTTTPLCLTKQYTRNRLIINPLQRFFGLLYNVGRFGFRKALVYGHQESVQGVDSRPSGHLDVLAGNEVDGVLAQ